MSANGKNKLKSRRHFLRNTAAMALAMSPLIAKSATNTSEGITFAGGERPLVKFPGKRELILVHSRPPHLETPFRLFNESLITPNDAFFVRYHLANIPNSVDLNDYRLSVKGAVKTPVKLSLDELKALPGTTEVVAVNQCTGNSRGYSSPRVFGAQLGNGAMGNARWTGVPLKTVLEHAGVLGNAKQVAFNGLDQPILPTTPDYRKTLDIEHALSMEPLLAWGMNGEDLPFLNGYPLKLIVPGYFGTYWVKHLSEIDVLDQAFEGHDAYFMNSAYRLPDNDCLCVSPGSVAAKTLPVSSLPVRSFITSVMTGDQINLNKTIELKGIAFDAGAGIKNVDVSTDSGRTWQSAKLGESLGRFSFREWKIPVQFKHKGEVTLMVRASNMAGEQQPEKANWNPSGYGRHSIESTLVMVG